MVGFDGMIEFNIETQNTAMQWTTENGATCFADAALPKTIKAYDDAGERKCGATINAMSVAEFLAK